MNKANARLLELALSGRGRDLALHLAVSQLSKDPDEVFNPNLNSEQKQTLKVLASLTSRFVAEDFSLSRFSTAIVRGHWVKAMEGITELAQQIGVSQEEGFSLTLGLLLVPACYVDQFTLLVANHAKIPDVSISPRLMNATPAFHAFWESWTSATGFTRETLIRFANSGLAIATRDPNLFWVVEDSEDKKRLVRFDRALRFISENTDTYSEVMRLVNDHRWEDADALATCHLNQIGLQGGRDFDNPPLLADFLVIAMTHFWHHSDIVQTQQTKLWSYR